MIIIADSGSTKCDWLVLNDKFDIINHVKTIGYNPYFHNEHYIAKDLKQNGFFKEHRNEVKEIYFYGAGCSTFAYSNIVFKGLSDVFCEAEIQVDHDLKASALACYKGSPMISCILGTGSNSCYFDGSNVSPGNPSLGYVVGDEASGSYFGKQLLNAYFCNQLPSDLHGEFIESYALTHEEFTEKVYASDRANVYLASFMNFYTLRKEHPYVKEVIKNGFQEFIEKHICCFENYRDVKINFVGSIAFFFQEEMEELGAKYNLKFDEFIQKPVFGLIDYHKENRKVKVK